MEGKSRWIDDVFIERLWRSLKYEWVYLHAFETGSEASTDFVKGSPTTPPRGRTRPSAADILEAHAVIKTITVAA